MTHRMIQVTATDEVCILAEFQNGVVKEYDISKLYSVYPQFKIFEKEQGLFRRVSLDMGGYGISWNDELDLDAEEIWENGIVKAKKEPDLYQMLAHKLQSARNSRGLTQKQLAEITGIYQADISKIERGIANPSLLTLKRLADGMGMKVSVDFV